MAMRVQQQLQQFEYGGNAMRAVQGEGGEPWFVAADVLAALTLDRKALERLDDDEKGVNSIHTPGGEQEVTVVNESGLYSLILGSRKPEAKAFKRWVTHEVLPAIRRSGSYGTHGATPAAEEKTKRAAIDGDWIDQSMRNAQALIEIAQDALGPDAHRHMPGMRGPDVAMGLAGLLLRRWRLLMDFDDIHAPKLQWISARALLVDPARSAWADDLIRTLDPEQVGRLLVAATRRIS